MNAPKMPKMPIAQHRQIASLLFPFYLADRKQQMIYYTYKISLYSKSNYDTDKALCRRIGRAGQVCKEDRGEGRLCEEHTQWVLLLLLTLVLQGFLPLSFNRGEGRLCEEFETMKFETVSAQRWINVDGTKNGRILHGPPKVWNQVDINIATSVRICLVHYVPKTNHQSLDDRNGRKTEYIVQCSYFMTLNIWRLSNGKIIWLQMR